MRGLAAVLVVVAACQRAPESARVDLGRRPADRPDRRLAALLHERCAGCHGGGASAPPLPFGDLDRTTALRAAMMISSERMPPGPGELSPADRARLIAGLCRFASPRAPERCLTTYDPVDRAPFIRGPKEYLRALDMFAAGASETPGASLLIEHFVPGGRVFRLDPTVEVLVSILAAETCGAGTARGGQAFDACVRAALDRDMVVLPPPAPDDPNR